MEPSTQTTQSSPSNPVPTVETSHKKLYIALGVALVVVVVAAFVGLYMWQQSTYTAQLNEINLQKATLEKDMVLLKEQLIKEEQRTIREAVTSSSTKGFSLLDTAVAIEAPVEYSFTKSNESNRRGSFVSYNVQPKELKSPQLQEVQFFSENSIKMFKEKCSNEPCFTGDVPDLIRYSEQKKAFLSGKDYQQFLLKNFNERSWFVTTIPCAGDSCSIREYTTFLGDIKTDVWIMMASSTEESAADILFGQIKIR